MGLLDYVLSKHEQGGSYMADGYARARGGLGACVAISGGAALNLMRGVASALGVKGVRAEGFDDLRPTHLDVRVDPDAIPPGIMTRMRH